MLPDPTLRYPVVLPDGSAHEGTVFLNQVIDHPRFIVGDYTYASDFDPPQDWGARLAPYLFPFSAETLRIGKFCQIAHGVRFITSSANHAMDGLTCYPFPIFDADLRASADEETVEAYQPDQRDTVIGHDVWLGYGAMVLPGARIGTGAVIGAGAVVRGTVPDYGIVTGNPGQVIKCRFAPGVIAQLLALEWWDWPAEHIAAAAPALMAGDLDRLSKL